MPLTYTNPRTVATFEDWPSGSHRVKCKFFVEEKNGKYRVCRMTTDKNGMWCKEKYGTYAGPAAIVDGSDGKTYILQFNGDYGWIRIIHSDLKSEGYVSERDNPEHYNELLNIIKSTPK